MPDPITAGFLRGFGNCVGDLIEDLVARGLNGRNLNDARGDPEVGVVVIVGVWLIFVVILLGVLSQVPTKPEIEEVDVQSEIGFIHYR